MLTGNMLKSKKALAPLRATLLLIAIAVAAILVTYAWTMTYMGTTAQQAGLMPYKTNVAFSSGTTLTIDVGNSGTASGKIAAIYIGNSSSTLHAQTTISYSLSHTN